MHRSIGAVAMTVLVVTSVLAMGFVGAAGASDSTAEVSISDQNSGGHTVVVDEVTVPNGGFVTIHDATMFDEDDDESVFTSVRGSSAYLEAGTHEDVVVHLDSPLAADDELVAMPHHDTSEDRIYRFVSSGGSEDGPYTADGEPVVDTATVTASATVEMADQDTDGESVLVDEVELSEGGFVTIHDETLLDGEVLGSVVGVSEYLEAGVHENVRVELDEELEDDQTVIPMPHRDTNDNQAYDFVDTNGAEDGPFLDADGEAVVDTAAVTVSDQSTVEMADQPTGGHAVVVDWTFVPEGGFVTIHDSTLLDGAVLGSVRGTSDYLEPGLHADVVVELDDPLEADDTLLPMTHRDTNDNQVYDFVDTDGAEDGPYATADGDPVMDTAEVTVSAGIFAGDAASDGNSVTIDRVDLSEDGFVTIHDPSLGAGAVFESVRGTSDYLEAGVHYDVDVALDEPLTESQTILAMPHRDTNDNEAYDFVDTDGAEDGPFLDANEEIVMDAAATSVLAQTTFADQSNVEDTIVVDSVTLHAGGFVTIHDETLLDGAVFESVRGTSEYLGPGTHENVEITIDEVPGGEDTLLAMPHRDTNDNQAYDFVDTDGADDGPYLAGGEIVMDAAAVTAVPTDDADDDADDMPPADSGMDDEGTDGDGPGFGAVAALLALLGAAGVARRLN